jgi:hypothetical protein
MRGHAAQPKNNDWSRNYDPVTSIPGDHQNATNVIGKQPGKPDNEPKIVCCKKIVHRNAISTYNSPTNQRAVNYSGW